MTSLVSGPEGLPRRVRIAAAVCLVLSILTGMLSAMEAIGLSHFSEYREAHLEQRRTTLLGGDPIVAERLYEAQFAALEPMREPRSVLLGALAVACAFTFVASGRLLRPAGLPRDGMRRMLGGAALTAAILRTIDGAQWTVVARRMGVAMAENLGKLPEFQDPLAADQLKQFMPSLMAGSSVLQTAVVAGTFALIGQYFRSQGVRDAITAKDGPTE
ncbi:hypothetical protein DRW03_22730 [Corallococcus sp. H22C18031201]|uniref:hypothetical protein n=1 Tax=Citreicoccus inhibens TaxID=2849499 RepID=UPI000E728235|nr:hypothetical protein [Citreicoccus inhibens]MBU8899759.1 hypothetical protein [Citreicoccus inhibens]RJS19180.1 hypothetical protein DRW03_22730 [Corallococcus sp. H22C18031201]